MSFARLRNGGATNGESLPRLGAAEFRKCVLAACGDGARLSALFAVPTHEGQELLAVLSNDSESSVWLASAPVGRSFLALTPDLPQAHLFEREIAERNGIVMGGHPWPKPVRRPDGVPPGASGFFTVRGDEVHEVAVGPVHAGVIEPGHFRFQCHGERVLTLEIALGYQHRGAERALEAGPDARSIHYAETACGDTTAGHATAYAMVREALAAVEAPPRARALRAIAVELERLANHAGDLGALASDVAFLPTSSFCGRLRGEFLNLTAELCGSRFGRGLVRPGGVAFDVDEALAAEIRARLSAAGTDLREASSLLFGSSSAVARFDGIGAVSADMCRELGVVGVAARASGLARDVRATHPVGPWRSSDFAPAQASEGDVLARARVRWLECEESFARVDAWLSALPAGPVRVPCGAPAPDQVAVALVEGWRGEICHVAATDASGRFRRYRIVDPSMHNWTALEMAMRGQAISDFPICNKSFNLSYCGHDL